MNESNRDQAEVAASAAVDVTSIVRQAIEEFTQRDQAKNEPAYKAELQEERRRREQLERRLNELVEENRLSKQIAEEAQTGSTIRAELQRLGVAKVDLAFRAVREDIVRAEDGRLIARGEGGEMGVKDYLANFVNSNPEFLPARISGGSGVTSGQKAPSPAHMPPVDLDRIKPGMSREEMERVRQEILRVASHQKGM
ncbi:MAG TPA: hypothetical protein VKE70_16885 [Candidatus Solibacter sp.]|nr:hypothetical protein [Candidatus Solibacter sp.]